METKITHDEQGNQILNIYFHGNLISQQIKKVHPDSEIPMPAEEEKILKVSNSLFYLPNYKDDLIQGIISGTNNYFSFGELKVMGSYLDKNSVVVDAGANIGNHTLYFANECNVKKIYAFEPVPYTYKILAKNIEINNLGERVEAICAGLSDKVTSGAIKTCDLKNLGGTNIMPYENGGMKLITLDSMKIKEKIDFIKIDVERMDYETLCGAKETILRDKPTIAIESFREEYAKTEPFLKDLGYEMAEDLGNFEYIFAYKH